MERQRGGKREGRAAACVCVSPSNCDLPAASRLTNRQPPLNKTIMVPSSLPTQQQLCLLLSSLPSPPFPPNDDDDQSIRLIENVPATAAPSAGERRCWWPGQPWLMQDASSPVCVRWEAWGWVVSGGAEERIIVKLKERAATESKQAPTARPGEEARRRRRDDDVHFSSFPVRARAQIFRGAGRSLPCLTARTSCLP